MSNRGFSVILGCMKIVLASGSPRRKELLKQVGIEYEVITADCDEDTEEADPAKVVKELSYRKASAVLPKVKDAIVIGADTVVAYEGEILGKPKDEAEALDMLSLLSGRKHKVYTGVTLLYRTDKGKVVRSTFAEATTVKMYDNHREDIKEYVASKEPLDKAGAYGIQGLGAVLVESISGDYNNVVGLPVARLVRELREFEKGLKEN